MLLKIYKSNQPLVLVGLPIVILSLWFPQLLADIQVNPIKNSSTVFTLIQEALSLQFVNQIVAMGLIIISGILFNIIINSEEIFEKQTYLPAFIYVVIMSLFKDYHLLHPIIIGNFFIILALRRLFQIKRAEDARAMMFDAGFYIGLAALFYPFYIVLHLLAVSTVLILRPFVWREHALGLLGMLLPFVFLAFYYFSIGEIDQFGWSKIIHFDEEYWMSFISSSNLKRALGLTLSIITGGMAARAFLNKQRSSSLRFKRLSNIFLSYGFILVVITLIQFAFKIEAPIVFMSAIFAAFFFSFYFFYARKEWLAALIFYLFLAFVVVNIYFDFVYKIFN